MANIIKYKITACLFLYYFRFEPKFQQVFNVEMLKLLNIQQGIGENRLKAVENPVENVEKPFFIVHALAGERIIPVERYFMLIFNKTVEEKFS